MGSCTAGGAYVPAMSDESIIVRKQGTIFLGGPPLVKAATGETVSAEELGGAEVHTRQSGVADHYALNDDHALEIVRNIVANLNTVKKVDIALREPRPPAYDPAELDGVVPASLMTQYDTREIIARLVDACEMDEFKANYAQTLVTGFAHIEGMPGRDPRQQRHPLFGDGAEGHALHRAGLPAQDPAAVPAEHHRLHGGQGGGGRRHRPRRRQDGDGGRLRAGAEGDGDHRRLATAPATTPCAGAPTRPRFLFTWPNARISVMGGPQAAGVLATVRRENIEAEGKTWSAAEEAAFKKPVLENFEREGHPYYATARIWDDGIIAPRETRRVVALSLSAALNAPIPEMRFGVFRM